MHGYEHHKRAIADSSVGRTFKSTPVQIPIGDNQSTLYSLISLDLYYIEPKKKCMTMVVWCVGQYGLTRIMGKYSNLRLENVQRFDRLIKWSSE